MIIWLIGISGTGKKTLLEDALKPENTKRIFADSGSR